ncbi:MULTISPECIES: FlgB family protein [Halocynthiibacter]|uniref:Flagellar basal body rod protein FlgB n=1 Tax=Halocynthiibacter halioticoli TaxID=2986804 RepID=A0AAE3IWM2_9RHOB|nr:MULTISPECIES: FlgB family protein [Halocynthiibacter]MCV6823069.1 FlgB family protein [Halocynthiibacter halioticoli]MCW4056070.1 FlgB family protein [Halocynthiibacter sp. SDUM655004]
MFENISVLRMSQAMTNHASTRQSVIAENVAHADTPAYKAKTVKPFAELYGSSSDTQLKSTRSGHLDFQHSPTSVQDAIVPSEAEASPNGNNVGLERELMNASIARHDFDTAIAIYKSTLNVLRTSIR